MRDAAAPRTSIGAPARRYRALLGALRVPGTTLSGSPSYTVAYHATSMDVVFS